MIYITHILLIMAAIWDIKKMEVPLTISVMLYLVHTCELLSSNYWKIDFTAPFEGAFLLGKRKTLDEPGCELGLLSVYSFF